MTDARPQNLDELVEAAQRDTTAVDALLRALRPRIFCMSMQLCHDSDDAEEIVQDTMLGVVRGLADFRQTCATTTWVYTIAKHACCRRLRGRNHAPAARLSLDDIACTGALFDPSQRPDEVVAAREMWDRVQEALLALPTEERTLLLMREREGLAAKEIAKSLGITTSAAKSRLHRARQDLRAQLVTSGFGD